MTNNSLLYMPIALITGAILLASAVVMDVFGSSMVVTPPPNTGAIMNLSVVFENHTVARLNHQALTEDQGNAIVESINKIISSAAEEEEPETTEESSSDGGGSGSGDGGSGDDGGGGDGGTIPDDERNRDIDIGCQPQPQCLTPPPKQAEPEPDPTNVTVGGRCQMLSPICGYPGNPTPPDERVYCYPETEDVYCPETNNAT